MSTMTVLVWMRVRDAGTEPDDLARVEVFRFEWDPRYTLPRAGETMVFDQGLPLLVRHVYWDNCDPEGLHPEIEVHRRADHPAILAAKAVDRYEEAGP